MEYSADQMVMVETKYYYMAVILALPFLGVWKRLLTISLFSLNCLTLNFVSMLHYELLLMFVSKDFVQGCIVAEVRAVNCDLRTYFGAYFRDEATQSNTLIY